MERYKGNIHSFESFGSVDGPGVRCVVFLQGCDMRCKYCHNPETWAKSCGDLTDVNELYERIKRYKSYWGKNGENGGVTVSGGEPLLQVDFVTELFKRLKDDGIHTALDTSGHPFSEDSTFLEGFNELLKYTDLVILDLKAYDSVLHKELCGFSNENILKMARYLSENGKDMWIRHVLVPGITDSEDDLRALSAFIEDLKTVRKTEVLPYHTLGAFKWEKLGIEYPLHGVPTPTAEDIERAEKILKVK